MLGVTAGAVTVPKPIPSCPLTMASGFWRRVSVSTVLDLPLVFPHVPPTFGDVLLRGFTDEDIPMLRDLSTDPYVPLTGMLPSNATVEDARNFIERQFDRLTAGAAYSFCVALRHTNLAVGQAGLWLTTLEHGRAEAGYSIAPAHRGRGMGRQALTALTAFAWTIPELHRIELYIEPWNLASARIAVAAGYEREGPLRSHQPVGDKRVDMQLFAALRPSP